MDRILLRTVLMIFVLLLVSRILVRRNPVRATSFELMNYFVVAVMTAAISLGIIKDIRSGIIALAIWVLMLLAFEYLSVKSKLFYDLIKGRERVLIRQGKIMEENLLKERMTGEELLSALRACNMFSLADVEFAQMEPAGYISVLPKAERKPVTPYDLGQKVSPRAEPQLVIYDGNIMDEALAEAGLNRGWLNGQLERLGVSVDNVFIGQVDSSGDLYVDLFDDSISMPSPNMKEILYGELERCQADLMRYALEAGDQGDKEMYGKDAEILGKIMNRLEPYLLR